MPVQVGDVRTNSAGDRVVVYLVNHQGVCYDRLPPDGSGGGCFGPGAAARFADHYPQVEGRMTMAGAYKLYRKERDRRLAAERTLDRLEEDRRLPERGPEALDRVRPLLRRWLRVPV